MKDGERGKGKGREDLSFLLYAAAIVRAIWTVEQMGVSARARG